MPSRMLVAMSAAAPSKASEWGGRWVARAGQLPTFAAAFSAVLAAHAGILVLGLPRLTRLLHLHLGTERGPAPASASWAELPPDLAARLRRIDRVIAATAVSSPCLIRSLAAAVLLTGSSRKTLRIGIARASDPGAWCAHAWLELDGVRLPEPRGLNDAASSLSALGTN